MLPSQETTKGKDSRRELLCLVGHSVGNVYTQEAPLGSSLWYREISGELDLCQGKQESREAQQRGPAEKRLLVAGA